jgi:hypothetical protein
MPGEAGGTHASPHGRQGPIARGALAQFRANDSKNDQAHLRSEII